jgi:hypothetical protein
MSALERTSSNLLELDLETTQALPIYIIIFNITGKTALLAP